jgi:hypothetical protein
MVGELPKITPTALALSKYDGGTRTKMTVCRDYPDEPRQVRGRSVLFYKS